MKKKYFLLIFFASYFSMRTSAFSQTSFERTYGGSYSETGTCIQKTLDGNYIVSGMESSFTNGFTNFYLLKIDPLGNHLWSKVYGGTPGSDRNYYVHTCADGGFIMTGGRDTTGSGLQNDLYLIRTDSNGNLQWSTTIGGTGDDYGWYVLQTNDGGFISSGETNSFSSNGSYDGYLVKVNSAGALQWTKDFGGTGGDFLFSIAPTSDGGYILGGESSTHSFGSADNWLIKTNSNGDTLWTKQIGRFTEESCNSVFQTNDGGYVLAGDVHIDTTKLAHHISIIKTDSGGNMLWNRAYGSSPGAEIAYDVKPAPNNGFTLLCYSGFYGAGGKDLLFIQTDSTGIMKWAKTYGSTGNDDSWFFQTTTDGGFMLAGATTSFGAGNWDIYLVRTDSIGNTKCDDSLCTPEIDFPVLQTRSGFFVTSGGVQKNPVTIITNSLTQTTNPCALVGIVSTDNPEIVVGIYPNPFSEKAIIEIKGIREKEEMKFEMYDVLGKPVIRNIIPGAVRNFLINRETLSGGIYFYQITSQEKNIATGKLIIE